MRAGVYHCCACAKPLPDPADESRPSRWLPGDARATCADCLAPWAAGHACSPYALGGRAEAKVLRVVATDPPAEPAANPVGALGPSFWDAVKAAEIGRAQS